MYGVLTMFSSYKRLQ